VIHPLQFVAAWSRLRPSGTGPLWRHCVVMSDRIERDSMQVALTDEALGIEALKQR